MDMLGKMLKSLGIDKKQLQSMQTEAARVPELLEALVTQNNGQVKALKQILQNQKNLKGQLDHITHYLQAKGMR